ncbi:MAG: hypothetical protein WBX11_18285 [Thiobacillaceae bacterium]
MIGVLLHRWHRRMGAVAGLFVLWLAASGIILNHSADLGLDHTAISAPWLIRLYGLHAVVPDRGFRSTTHWLVGTDARTVIDGRPLAAALPQPLGLVAANDLLFAANASGITIIDPLGQLVDTLQLSDLPLTNIHRIGQGDGVVVIADMQDHRFASRDGLNWMAYGGSVIWAMSEALPTAIAEPAAPYFRPQLPLERILLDAHSGRIIGPYGPVLVDAVGVVFILIALSGFWIYLRHRLRRSHH